MKFTLGEASGLSSISKEAKFVSWPSLAQMTARKSARIRMIDIKKRVIRDLTLKVELSQVTAS